ncbi:MAG: response regulator [Chlamydiota bacterium]|nr:response regulator [Chlamydiota bacterium]
MDKIDKRFDAKVLVADDYPINLELTKEMLEMMDCDVDIAEDGAEALECYNDNAYNIIFLDIQMPGKDGYEVCREIRKIEKEQNKPSTAIVALTANAMAEDRDLCLAAGMDEYLAKPVRGQDLVKILEKFLSKKNNA